MEAVIDERDASSRYVLYGRTRGLQGAGFRAYYWAVSG